MPREVEIAAPINIALLKYWGKRDELKMLPFNNSLSMTLSQSQLMSHTKVACGPEVRKSSFILNGIQQPSIPPRMKDVIILAQLKARLSGISVPYRYVRIESTNNFPTKAGLASSASGLAALTFGLAHLYSLSGDLSELARCGSGSACRSMEGGFVHWTTSASSETGDDATVSVARQLYPASHWPELRVLICVTSASTKSVGSTQAMRRSVLTSDLFHHGRLESVRRHEHELLDAISARNFPDFAEVVMRESNQLHAICLDTWPPCVYLSQVSLEIIRWVHTVNSYLKRTVVAYTFDAGPNAFLIALAADIPMLQQLLVYSFGSLSTDSDNTANETVTVQVQDGSKRRLHFNGIQYPICPHTLESDLLSLLPSCENGVSYVISTELGDGPRLIRSRE
ncbi:unnamed protein product [Calicophoron daubneyi]|uniref:Diphosphomevalonate decarboxylase n=1 Tax=Calicophoron daubneyi TaxID=300641 RepID=A0AAV2TBX5_CALDB